MVDAWPLKPNATTTHVLSLVFPWLAGVGAKHDFHQWVLACTPGHKFLGAALHSVSESVLQAFFGREHSNVPGVVELTGPKIYAECVVRVMREYGCELELGHSKSMVRAAVDFLLSRVDDAQQVECPGVGVLQVFGSDYMGGRLQFKAQGVQAERTKAGHRYYEHDYKTQESFWSPNFTLLAPTRHTLLLASRRMCGTSLLHRG